MGDPYGGGMVFCVSQTPDTSKCVHKGSGNYGLIIAKEDLVNYYSNPSHGVHWSSVHTAIPGARSDDDGLANTRAIIAALPKDNPANNAAWLCHRYQDPAGSTDQHLTDWYLPAKNELDKMYVYAVVNNLIGKGCAGEKPGGVQCLVGGYYGDYMVYWSSTQYPTNSSNAWDQSFGYGDQSYGNKILSHRGVRAIRAFNNSTIK